MALSANEYFGERAIMYDEPRAASVWAVGPATTVLTISRAAFEEVLGPLEAIIDADRRRRERETLEEAGAVVRPQTRAGKKGAALRECVESALEQFQLTPDGVICYQELEKVEMIPLQAEVAAFMMRSGTDVCVPKREDGLFRATYPVEQYHSEHFANLHLDALGRPVGLPALDWTFGPVAFRASMARHWLQCRQQAQTRCPRSGSAGYLRLEAPSRMRTAALSGLQSRVAAAWALRCNPGASPRRRQSRRRGCLRPPRCEGELWDAQLVPIVHASRWHGARVETFEVGHAHPEPQP